MFDKIKKRRREGRIFLSRAHMDLFAKQAALARVEGIVRQISRIKQAIVDNDRHELYRRQKFLTLYGIKAPKSLNQCDKLIQDLRLWRER